MLTGEENSAPRVIYVGNWALEFTMDFVSGMRGVDAPCTYWNVNIFIFLLHRFHVCARDTHASMMQLSSMGTRQCECMSSVSLTNIVLCM